MGRTSKGIRKRWKKFVEERDSVEERIEERESFDAEGSETDDASDRVVPINSLQDRDRSGGQNEVRESLERIVDRLEGGKPAASAEPEDDHAYDEAPEVVLPRALKPSPSRSKSTASGKRAAFTLRLDQERHLMLRLACTVRGSSAQQLVTDALDGLLAEMPEIAMLAAQVQRRPN